MKKWIKRLCIFAFFVAILTSIVIGTNTDMVRRTEYEVVNSEKHIFSNKLSNDVVVRQSFVCSQMNFSGFDLVFRNGKYRGNDMIRVELYNKTDNKQVQVWNMNRENIPNNQYITFALDHYEYNAKGKMYEILISSDSKDDSQDALRLYLAENVECTFPTCTYAGNALQAHLQFTIQYAGNIDIMDIHSIANIVNVYFILACYCSVIMFVIVQLIKSRNKIKSLFQYIKANRKLYSILTLGNVVLSIVIELMISILVIGHKNTLGTYFNWYRLIYILCIFFVVEEIVLYFKKKINKIEHTFLSIAMAFGILLVATQPFVAGVNWDGQIHYERTMNMANLTQLNYTQADEDMIFINYDFTPNMSKAKENFDFTSKYVGTSITTKPKQYTMVYSYLSYMPTALGYKIATILHAPFWLLFSIGRVINYIIYVYLIYQAMKKLKWGKEICAIIGLFPTALFLAANYGYDHWITAMSVLALAYIIGEIQNNEEKMSLKSAIVILGAFFIGLIEKAIYFPLVTLCFFIPKEKFKSKKECNLFRGTVCLVILVLVSSFLLPMFCSGPGTGDARGGSDVNAAGQIAYILSNPLKYTKTLLKFIFIKYINPVYAKGYISAMAYLGTSKIGILSWLSLFFISIFCRNEEEKQVLETKKRIWTFFIVFGTICLVATALYISFTPVGLNTINGCQHRYLYPVLFPLCYFIGSINISNKIREKMDKRKIMTFAFVLLAITFLGTYGQLWIGKLY